jgi:hypothetical protein
MSERSKVWQPLRDKCLGQWERIENKVVVNFPDTIYLMPDGRTGFVELRYMNDWPKRPETLTDLGIKKGQAFFLSGWVQNGGRGFVFARIGADHILIKGDRLDPIKATKRQWIERASYYKAGGIDFETLAKFL